MSASMGPAADRRPAGRGGPRDRGFTLVEVLVAFVILSLALGVVFRSLSSGLSHERTARLATERVLAARSLLDRVGQDIPLELGTTEGDFAGGAHWVLTVTQADQEANLAARRPGGTVNAYLVALHVAGTDGRSLDLQTVRLGR